ncbi:MAG: efflux RND transporter periplasmic adaptor subunit [Polyangiaceae bacterium]
MKRLGKIVLAVAISLGVAGGGYGGYVYLQKPAKTTSGQVLTIKRGSLTETASASGTIAPHIQVEVKSRSSGQVIEILVAEGDHVEAGQLLVKLDPTDAERNLTVAKAALEKVKADISASQASVWVASLDAKNGKANKETADKSAAMGLGTNEAAREATHTADVAAANVSLKSAQLASAQVELKKAELSVQDAETRLKETTIYAPMSGTVLDIPVEKGTIVTSALTSVSGGTSVMTIADLSDLRVVGAIDEAQIGRVSPKQLVEIRVDAYPDRTFKGVVDRISPLGKTTSSIVTFDVEIVIVDENKNLLMSGMSADVDILTKKEDDVLLVPLIAVQSSGRARFVRLKSGEKREIKTGATDGTNMVVLSGLEEGDSVVAGAVEDTKGGSTAKSGQGQGQNRMPGMGAPPGMR